jgi:uncharacterized protein (UPF0210 family)
MADVTYHRLMIPILVSKWSKIASIMRDTGTMAFRLNKPLTVRLFLVPGLKVGDLIVFESDDLCNCAVLAVP